jgi:hypothetical protein
MGLSRRKFTREINLAGIQLENRSSAAEVARAFEINPLPAVGARFANWLGLGSRRPDLVVRFGPGPEAPYPLPASCGRCDRLQL